MCRDQNRSELKRDGTPHFAAVKLMYCGRSSVQIRGAVTGDLYYFSRPHSAQPVDPRDATIMMRTRMFKQIRWH
jgi:hypothetical protein